LRKTPQATSVLWFFCFAFQTLQLHLGGGAAWFWQVKNSICLCILVSFATALCARSIAAANCNMARQLGKRSESLRALRRVPHEFHVSHSLYFGTFANLSIT
jgi:hypothetical protein